MLNLIFCLLALIIVMIILEPVGAFQAAFGLLVLWAIVEVIRLIRRH